MIDVLEDDGRDPVEREITGFINALSEDEQIDLVALMRLGRGDATIEEWKDLAAAGSGRTKRSPPRAICWASRCSATFCAKVSASSASLGTRRADHGPVPGRRRGLRRSSSYSRAVHDHGAELVAFLHRKMRLRGVRERELRGDVVNARTRRQPL